MNDTLETRPGTASVRVIDLGWQGLLNPNPLSREEDESLVDEYLSPARLKALTGEDDLQQVKALQMCVDTRERTLGNFGTYMQNLRELKLNNSVILSVRDLGTSLSHLQVLWMARCSLTDLDGIASFFSLKELYLAYNDLHDLSQVSMLENLEILDLEGNSIDHISELQYLALCSNLTTLTVEGNPICVQPSPEDTECPDYNYRTVAISLIPQLQLLDDVPTDQKILTIPHTPTQDWMMVRDYIKESIGSQLDEPLDLGNAQRPSTAKPRSAQVAPNRRPQSALRPSTSGNVITSHKSTRGSPLSEPSEDGLTENEASDLTHGVGRVICGNPIKALRARKEKLGLSPPSKLQPQDTLENTFHPESASHKDRTDVFAELKAWREKHQEVLQRIQNERAPQVLIIKHSDEEADSLSSSSEDEDLEDTSDSGYIARLSPQTSSPSPRSLAVSCGPQYRGEMTLQDISQQPSPPISPSPPSSLNANSRLSKGADIRARRLLKSVNQHTTVPRVNNGCLGDEVFLPSDVQDNISITSKIIGHTSDTEGELRSPAKRSPSNSRSTTDKNASKMIPSHQPVIRSFTKTRERPSPPNIIPPITAKGIFTRLPNRLTLLTSTSQTST